jgi:ABC-2 type transport system ATP-binding protein
MEIRLAGPLNGLVRHLEDQVSVIAHGEDWVRYAVTDPSQFNPLLLTELARQNVPVITLSEVSRSLEEVYLRIVEGESAEAK